MAKRPMLPPQLAGPPFSKMVSGALLISPVRNPGCAARPFRQERFPIAGNHVIEKNGSMSKSRGMPKSKTPGKLFKDML